VTGLASEALSIGRVVVTILLKKLLAATDWDVMAMLRNPMPFHELYWLPILVLTVSIVFSSMAPVVLFMVGNRVIIIIVTRHDRFCRHHHRIEHHDLDPPRPPPAAADDDEGDDDDEDDDGTAVGARGVTGRDGVSLC
jgi:hypothetical protein